MLNLIKDPKVLVAIPCFNEAKTIAQVVGDFKKFLPGANICVFDNNSTDRSADLARKSGAAVVPVPKRGKGNVMREIFDQAEADLILVVDGDNTYFAEEAPLLIKTLIENNYDMVVGDRLTNAVKSSFKKINLLGNHLIAAAINLIFGTNYRDVLSGYRVFSRRFIKRVALLTSEFEVEVELTLRALEENLAIKEVPISYRARPDVSRSKLKPFRDGISIMITIAMILRDVYPLRLYGLISLGCFTVALIAAILRFMNFFGTFTFPNTILTGLLLLFVPSGLITFAMGLILSAVNTRFSEIKQIILRNK